MLAEPGSLRCNEVSSLTIGEGSSGIRTSEVCDDATVDLEAVPENLPEADADLKLQAVDHIHRRRLPGFVALRGLAEPIGISGLRSGI